jgi:predicted nucleic acid-binding protein
MSKKVFDKFVLDKSILLQLFYKNEKALELFKSFVKGKIELFVSPETFIHSIEELTKNKKVNLKEAIIALYALNLNIVFPEEKELIEAIEFSKEYNISLEQALNIAISRRINATYITFDGLNEKLKDLTNIEKL